MIPGGRVIGDARVVGLNRTKRHAPDFVAWFHVVEELPAVGFYNSAGEAGASQSHKHMQVWAVSWPWFMGHEMQGQEGRRVPGLSAIARALTVSLPGGLML